MMTVIAIASAATEAAHTATEGGIATLGLDAKALIFQVINFAILLLLLRAFAYKPILRVLQQRQQTIEESLKNAKLIEEKTKQTEQQREAVLAQAQTQASDIVEQGHQRAQELVKRAEQKAQENNERLLTEAQAKIREAILEARTALRHEVLNLVAGATEKIIHEKLDSSKDAALIERVVSEETKL